MTKTFDYLKVNSHTATSDLINQAFSAGLLPVITKPTRVTHSTATLIDIIYVKLNTRVRLTPLGHYYIISLIIYRFVLT